MFRACFFAAVVLTATVVQGSGYYAAGNGYYCYQTAAGVNDGYYYTRTCTQGYWYCGKWYNGTCSYTRVAPIAIAQAPVQYSTNWKSDLLKAIEHQKDNQLFLQALRESGLQVPSTHTVAANHGTVITGTQTYQQGYYQPFAEQGSTLFGLKAYTPNIGQVDIQGTLNQLSRLSEQSMNQADNMAYAFSQQVGQIGHHQAEIAKIQEAGRVAVALAQASSPPRQVTTKFEARTGENSSRDARASSVPPQPPSPDTQTGAVLPRVWVGELFRQTCVKCHGPEMAKAELDLSNFANWNDDLIAEYGPKIAARVTSHDPEFQMPPPDSKIVLKPIEIKKILALLPLEEIPEPQQ